MKNKLLEPTATTKPSDEAAATGIHHNHWRFAPTKDEKHCACWLYQVVAAAESRMDLSCDQSLGRRRQWQPISCLSFCSHREKAAARSLDQPGLKKRRFEPATTKSGPQICSSNSTQVYLPGHWLRVVSVCATVEGSG